MTEPPALTLRVPDPDHRWTAVRVRTDVPLPSPDLQRRGGVWVLELPPLRLQRFEYELQVTTPGGEVETIGDPSHAIRAPGAFGQKSVLEAPGYAPPWWLGAPAVDAHVERLPLGLAMRRRVNAQLWSPADAAPDQPLPLLLAHDGPEYDELAQLTRWAGAMVAAGRLPPFRLAMLPPGDRDSWYSASEGYARALAERLIPALEARAPFTGPPAGMGASLGALAMLHAHRRFPAVLGGLFLQSGSFFTPETDGQESGFSRFQRVVAFVRGVRRTRRWEHPVPVAMTCGAEEENAANNRLMAEALARQGYGVRHVENLDMHNYTGWRDTFEPHLTDLLRALWT